MNDRERSVNRDLQILGDAYRLGQIQREEYRARRRHVLATLTAGGDPDSTRRPMAGSPVETIRAPRPPAGEAGVQLPTPAASGAETSPRTSRKYGLLLVIGLLLAAAAIALALVLLKTSEPLPAVSSASSADDPLAELDAATARFSEQDDWRPAAIDAWMTRWQQLEPDLRGAALARPTLQQLHDQAVYKRSVRRALAAPDAVPEAGVDAAGDAIERLLHALDGAS
ncbi:MAG: hypothetical protein C0434_07245 [Xanthomonadaceae bacterium]|nr:hypothetical protein [Xanthomonadaceae bacterium]